MGSCVSAHRNSSSAAAIPPLPIKEKAVDGEAPINGGFLKSQWSPGPRSTASFRDYGAISTSISFFPLIYFWEEGVGVVDGSKETAWGFCFRLFSFRRVKERLFPFPFLNRFSYDFPVCVFEVMGVFAPLWMAWL